MEKILIIGGGNEQLPAIKIAKELGYFVVCNDMNEQAPGFSYADNHYVISISDVEGIRDIIQKEKVQGIATVATELAVPVIGKLCEEFNFPGHTYKMGLNATNKIHMHTCMEQHGVKMAPCAVLKTYDDLDKFINTNEGPWVFKPSDNSGQRGMSLVYNRSDTAIAFDKALKVSSDDKVLVESFIEGPEINVCGVVINGDAHILSLGDRVKDRNQSFGIAIQHLSPPCISAKEQEDVIQLAKAAVHALGLQTGILYPQIVVGPEGPVLMEIAIRMPGGHNREIAMYKSGVDMARAAVQLAMNKVDHFDDLITEKRFPVITIRFITRLDFSDELEKFPGFSNQEVVKKIPGILHYYSNLKEGDAIPELTSSAARFAAIIAVGDTREQVLDRAEKAALVLLNKRK